MKRYSRFGTISLFLFMAPLWRRIPLKYHTPMNILLASTSTLYGGNYLEYLKDEIKTLFQGIDEILFIPFARPGGISHEEYTAKVAVFFEIFPNEAKMFKEDIDAHEKETEKIFENHLRKQRERYEEVKAYVDQLPLELMKENLIQFMMSEYDEEDEYIDSY